METTTRVTGEFRIEFEPLPADDETIGRMQVVRAYTGGLAGTGVAQMLSVGTAIEGSAGWVAIELVTGFLDGLQGSFVLQHSGTMWRGTTSMLVTVLPDSGTDGLLGLRGALTMKNLGSHHTYAFDYAIDRSDD